MKKTFLMTLFALIFCLNGRGQSCLPNGISFNTQASIDNFSTNYPGCTEIGGFVSISGANITNLNGLSNLKSVNWLDISGNPGLSDLTGLNQLDTAGYFTITNNINLSSLAGLENLTNIQDGIGIWGNPALKNLNALSHVSNVPRWISIRENKALLSLQGLEGITVVKDTVHIVGNDALVNLAGLNNTTYIGELDIGYNNTMTSFAGLENLTEVGELYIIHNPLLANIDALKQLERIVDGEFEDLYIEENSSLTNLSGLENLSILAGRLRVVNNPLLSDCSVYAVCNHILNEPTLVTISGNASGCSTPAEVELQCHSIPVVAEVRLDNNGNCQSDPTDPLAADVQVRLEGVGQILLKATNQQGRTRFGYLESGPFDLLLPQFPAGNWAVCQEPITLNPNGSTDTIRATLLLSPLIQCPELTVHLGLPSFFRGCLRTSDLQVSTENTGTVTAQGVKIAVVIPPVLELLASVPPLDGQQGDTLFFDLGSLDPFGKSNVILTVRTKCDTFLVGQALCIETFATLDNACPKNLPAFSEIKASAKCVDGNLVRLSLENIGDAPTQGYHAYKIIRNDLIMNDNPFNLAAHESLSFDFNADGATWRLEATKFDDGTETAASVENCNGLTPGWITGFWQDHGPLEYDFDCRQVIGSYDPNRKTVVPNAYVIRPNKPMQYTIDFQNIGNDTAFRVLLRDALSTSLDLNTFRPGYASHPYSWEIKGRTLEVLFDPISLPGSGMNVAASQGFFSFEIDQKPDLPEGTYIQNTATIVFDYNPPIYTNYVTQQIGRLTVQVDEAQLNATAWQVLGNPTSNTAIFRTTEFISGDKQFELYDISGKRVRSIVFSGQIFEFQRDMLGSGMYFFRITDERGRVFVGKIILTD